MIIINLQILVRTLACNSIIVYSNMQTNKKEREKKYSTKLLHFLLSLSCEYKIKTNTATLLNGFCFYCASSTFRKFYWLPKVLFVITDRRRGLLLTIIMVFIHISLQNKQAKTLHPSYIVNFVEIARGSAQFKWAWADHVCRVASELWVKIPRRGNPIT